MFIGRHYEPIGVSKKVDLLLLREVKITDRWTITCFYINKDDQDAQTLNVFPNEENTENIYNELVAAWKNYPTVLKQLVHKYIAPENDSQNPSRLLIFQVIFTHPGYAGTDDGIIIIWAGRTQETLSEIMAMKAYDRKFKESGTFMILNSSLFEKRVFSLSKQYIISSIFLGQILSKSSDFWFWNL